MYLLDAIAVAFSACVLASCSVFPQSVVKKESPIRMNMQQGEYLKAFQIGAADYDCIKYKLARNLGIGQEDYARYLQDFYECCCKLDPNSVRTAQLRHELESMNVSVPQPQPEKLTVSANRVSVVSEASAIPAGGGKPHVKGGKSHVKKSKQSTQNGRGNKVKKGGAHSPQRQQTEENPAEQGNNKEQSEAERRSRRYGHLR